MAIMNGTDDGEFFDGTTDPDTINAGGGDDVAFGDAGDDTIDGGSGDDLIMGDAGNDVIDGGEGNDDLTGGPGRDTIRGGIGDDKIYFSFYDNPAASNGEQIDGGEGIDWLTFGAGNSVSGPLTFDLTDPATAQVVSGVTIVNIERASFGGGDFADTITGGALDDALSGGFGDDRLDGAGGNDVLTGGVGTDTILGGAGDDEIRFDIGDAIIDGGDGIDFARFSISTGGLTFDFTNPSVDHAIGSATVRNVERIDYFGGTGVDHATGGAFSDSISGSSGDDVLAGGGGDDTLSGGDGIDELRGGSGNDFLHSYEIENVAGDTVLDGGEGFDLLELNLRAFTGFTEIDLLVAGRVSGIEQINFVGGSGGNRILAADANDTLRGGSGIDEFHGRGGNDTIYGLGGADLLYGDDGDDFIDGDIGGDQLFGGAGNDNLRATGGAAILLDGGDGNDQLSAGGAADTLLGGSGDDFLNGEGGADYLEGGTGDDTYVVDNQADAVIEAAGEGTDRIDTGLATYSIEALENVENLRGTANGQTLSGNGGSNSISGSFGADTLRGLGGDDVLLGGAGNDILIGGAGIDLLTGGFGTDRFTYLAASDSTEAGMDRIVDLQKASGDKIDLTALGPVSLSFTGGSENNVPYTLLRAESAGGTLVIRVAGTIDASDVLFQAGGSAIVGTSNDDVIEGTAGPDDISGLDGNDQLYGLGADDLLDGGAGNDLLDGGAGADAMAGGTGNDAYVVDDAGDQVIEAAGEGTDEVRTALASYSLAALANVENLTGTSATGQTLTGNGLDNVIFAGMGDDLLEGGAGDDVLIGYGGSDVMKGGAGNDVYIIDAADTVVEFAGDGLDEVRTQAGIFVLSDALENLRATSDIGHDFRGNAGNNVIIGGDGNDIIRAQDGGGDLLFGKAGVDSFYMGGAFDNGDFVDGGDNRDSLILQGNYNLTLTWNITGGSSLANIEGISLLPGNVTQYGDVAGNFYSYNLTLVDGNVAAGQILKINGVNLRAGENFTLDASAELDGVLQVFGGFGTDTFKGGQQGDSFIFAHDGRFGAGDSVDGQGGYDILYLRGDYVIDFNAAGFAGSLKNVESIALLTSANTEFAGGGDGDLDYDITWNDAMLAAGATLTVNGSRLQSFETFVFHGGSETDGQLRLFGGAGADTLETGGGNDQLHGGGGADALSGGAGADLFRYSLVSDSTLDAHDTVSGFEHGVDKIDVNRVDAKASTADENEAFAFIGSNAFSAAGPSGPGELRAYNVSGDLWRVEGDVNGDGTADLVIDVHVLAGQPLTAADFVV